MKSEPLLRINNLSKTYQTGIDTDGSAIKVSALSDFNLEIKQGEFVAVVGASGSGKSTLVHCLGSFEEPDGDRNGVIKFYDQEMGWCDVWSDPVWYRQNFVGIVFQSFHLLPNLRVWQNVALPVHLTKCREYTPNSRDRLSKAKAVLRAVHLGEDIDNKTIDQISGGETQRVAIARALIKRPRLLLADEPTGNLDEGNKANIVNELRELVDQGVSVLMVTHDVRHVQDAAHRVIDLSDGCVRSGFEEEADEASSTSMATTSVDLHEEAKKVRGGRVSVSENRPNIEVADSGPAMSTPSPVTDVGGAEPSTVSGDTDDWDVAGGSPPELSKESLRKDPQTAGKTQDGDPTTPKAISGGEPSLPSEGQAFTPNAQMEADDYPETAPMPSWEKGQTRKCSFFSQSAPDLLTYASRDAARSKVSLLSNVAAILFGTILTTLLVSLLVGVNTFMNDLIPRIPGIDSVWIAVDYSEGADPITTEEYERLGNLPGANVAVPNVRQFAVMYRAKERESVVSLASASRDDPATKDFKLIAGSVNLDPTGWEIILTETVAKEIDNFNPIGLVNTEITLALRRYKKSDSLENPEIETEIEYPLKVLAIVEDTPKNVCYGSVNLLRFLRDFSTGRTKYAPDVGQKVDPEQISPRTKFEGVRVHFERPVLAQSAYNTLKRDSSVPYDVFWPGSELSYLRDTQLIAGIVLLGIGILATVAGSISIFNTLAASVTRKTREIGILKALGFRSSDIFMITLWQAILMGAIAGMTGLGIAWISNAVLNETVIEKWPELSESLGENGLFHLPIAIAVLIFATVVGICVVSGLLPSWQASRKTPMDAVRQLN